MCIIYIIGIEPALLDAYCRTRCATVEDVVFIRNTVDRIGSHYSPGTTILTLDIDTGLIKFRKEKTNLKSAWYVF